MWCARVFLLCLAAGAGSAVAQDEYSFDVSQFEKKPFELGGYAELRGEHFRLARDAALSQLRFFDQEPIADFSRGTGALQLEGLYRRGIASVRFVGFGSYASDYSGADDDTRVYEAYLTLAPSGRTTIDVGKKTLSWGKGYAWNPVGFVQRAKDPNDPDLSREGFVIAGGDFIRSFEGPLKTLALTPLVLPTSTAVNENFGAAHHLNPAAKLYLLYRDTDIDLVWLGAGSRSARYGVDFARNLTTNFEVHGEWAHVTQSTRPLVSPTGAITRVTQSVNSYLLGARYLTATDLTVIAEYYYNGTGYTEDEGRAFFQAIHTAYDAGNDALLDRLRNASQSALARPNSMRRYLYLRLSQKDPFDILYFTPALTVIANVDDGSRWVAPELLYTGITNLELRLRAFFVSRGQTERLRRAAERSPRGAACSVLLLSFTLAVAPARCSRRALTSARPASEPIGSAQIDGHLEPAGSSGLIDARGLLEATPSRRHGSDAPRTFERTGYLLQRNTGSPSVPPLRMTEKPGTVFR